MTYPCSDPGSSALRNVTQTVKNVIPEWAITNGIDTAVNLAQQAREQPDWLEMRFTVDRLDHIVINVRDIEMSASWYQRVLGMEREDFSEERRTALKFGGQKINLRPHDAELHKWATGKVTEPGAADICFITAVGPDDVVAHLKNCRVAVEDGPVAREGALGLMESVYCRDPDGNLVEIASYLTR